MQRHGTIVGIIAAASLASMGLAQSSYVVEQLGDVSGGDFWSRASAINDNGWIVGESKITFETDPRRVAVRWLPGMLEPDMLSGADNYDFSRGTGAISDNLIGGFAQVFDPFAPPRAFLWDQDNGFEFFIDEDNEPDIRGSRLGRLTEFDAALGWVIPTDKSLGNIAYIFDLNTRDLTYLNPAGPLGSFSLAHSMNEFGDVVGASTETGDKNSSRQAVIWPAGSVDAHLIPGLDDLNNTYDDVTASWIGTDGSIRGNAGNRDANDKLFAQNVIWTWDPNTQQVTMLGGLDGYDWIQVRGTNADGSMLTGYAYQDGEHTIDYLANHIGVIWTAQTGWVDVNTLISQGPANANIFEVMGVNASGMLCGSMIDNNGQVEAVRLSPGCLVLTVENLIVDEKVIVTVEGGTPGQRTAVLIGFGGAPSTFTDVKKWCATFGFQARMQGRKIKVAFSGIFDKNGRVVRKRNVREKARGLTMMFQAAERGTCPNQCMSNIVTRIAQ